MKAIITIANQKGGVGKTTTVISLAHGLAIQGNHVLIIDLDPQGQCALALDLPGSPGIRDWLIRGQSLRQVVQATSRERLILLPGDKTTAITANMLLAEHRGAVPLDLLLTQLRPALRNGLDYVLIDTSPSVGELQALALYAANLVLIPAKCDHWSQDSVGKTLDTITLVNRNRAEPANYAILPTFYDERANASREALTAYQAALPLATLPPIHQATRFADAGAAGQTIYEIEPNGRPATEYARLAWYVRDSYG